MANVRWRLLTKKRGSATQGLPPGKEDLAWVTNTVTLLYGDCDAVLVDTFLSVQHSKELVDWVAESGKNLTTIYVTHARSSLPGGRPWVELPRFFVSSFQFSLDIYFLPPRRMIVGSIPRFDSFDRVYKRLF